MYRKFLPLMVGLVLGLAVTVVMLGQRNTGNMLTGTVVSSPDEVPSNIPLGQSCAFLVSCSGNFNDTTCQAAGLGSCALSTWTPGTGEVTFTCQYPKYGGCAEGECTQHFDGWICYKPDRSCSQLKDEDVCSEGEGCDAEKGQTCQFVDSTLPGDDGCACVGPLSLPGPSPRDNPCDREVPCSTDTQCQQEGLGTCGYTVTYANDSESTFTNKYCSKPYRNSCVENNLCIRADGDAKAVCRQNICGDVEILTEGGEECDNGGTCMGGTMAGTRVLTRIQYNDCVIEGGTVDPQSGDGCSKQCKHEYYCCSASGDTCIQTEGGGGDNCSTVDGKSGVKKGDASCGNLCATVQPYYCCQGDDSKTCQAAPYDNSKWSTACGAGVTPIRSDPTCRGEAPGGLGTECTGYCGNKTVNENLDEECDDGNKDDNDECTNACKKEKCGDNIQSKNEECDDGNTKNDDGCSSACIKEPQYCCMPETFTCAPITDLPQDPGPTPTTAPTAPGTTAGGTTGGAKPNF